MKPVQDIGVTEARKRLGDLVDQVNQSRVAIRLSRHSRSVVIVPEIYDPLFTRTPTRKRWLAYMLTDLFFRTAPAHIRDPQIKELERLTEEQLKELLAITSLPIPRATRAKLSKKIGATFIDRLEKRYKIAKAIDAAEKEGLYEAAEDQTGRLDLAS